MPEKKITKPGTVAIERDFTWDRFVKDCANNKYVLVVGNEAVLNKDKNKDANGDSLKLLFDWTIEHLKETEGIIDNTSINFTQLSRRIQHLHSKVLDTLNEFNFEVNSVRKEIEPTLLNLLQTKCFRIVLTTTVDPYVELAMEDVWGKDGFRVLNIYDIENDDLKPNEQQSDEFNELQPTLYYVFGKADTDNRRNKFVLSENDAMSLIPKWFSVERPKELLKYIQAENRKILSVGCKFDDWLFRFFWFILRGEVNNLSNGQVAVEFKEEDHKLVKYLQQENIKLFMDARSFMKEAASKIESAIQINNLSRKSGGIFISYAHEDKYLALPLFYKLSDQGYNVWIDERLDKGREYDVRISKAINCCKIFMPILSTQVMNDLEKENSRYYRDKEWHIAQIRYDEEAIISNETNRMKVLPFIIGEYHVGGLYHQKTEQCIVNATAFEVAKESFESLKKTINKLL